MRNARTARSVVFALMAVGLAASACSSSSDSTADTGGTAATTATATAAANAGSDADLQSLLPVPANTVQTVGPDPIADDGIHLHYRVDGSPAEVMAAYESALEGEGWQVKTIVSSSGGGGGGATFIGTRGDAYGVFDGGGYDANTYIDTCTWPSMPANPNCSRGDR